MNAADLARAFEGFHRVARGAVPVMASPYLCPAGFWTQGYGHLCRQDSPPITLEIGEEYLRADLAVAEAAVRTLIRLPLAPPQLDALVDWTFNLGISRLRGSTLRAVINRGALERVPAELRRWVYGGGQKLPGLVIRREAEVALWNS